MSWACDRSVTAPKRLIDLCPPETSSLGREFTGNQLRFCVVFTTYVC